MSRSTRARSGPTTVVTLGDLEGSASSARPAEPDKPEVEPPRRSKRGRTARTNEEESLTPAEQDARTKGIDATLERAERAEKRKKRVEERSKRAIEKVIKADAEEAREKARKNKRAPSKRREASLAFQEQREEKVLEKEAMYDDWGESDEEGEGNYVQYGPWWPEGTLQDDDIEEENVQQGTRIRTPRELFNASDEWVRKAKAGPETFEKKVSGKMMEGGQEGRRLTLRDSGIVTIIVVDDKGEEHPTDRAWEVTKARPTQKIGDKRVDVVLFDFEQQGRWEVPEGEDEVMFKTREGEDIAAEGFEERMLHGALEDGHNGHVSVVRREKEEGSKKKGALLLRVVRQPKQGRHEDALYLEAVEDEMTEQEFLDWGGDDDFNQDVEEGESEQEDWDTDYDSADDQDWKDAGRKMTHTCPESKRKRNTSKQEKAPRKKAESEAPVQEEAQAQQEPPLEDQIKAMEANLEALRAQAQQEAAAAFVAP